MRLFQGSDDLLHPTRIIYDVTLSALPVCALIQYLVIKICVKFEEKKHMLFFQLRRAR